MPNQRINHRRRHAYNTRSNIIKKVRTPGNRLVVQYQKKRVNGQICGDCKCTLQAIPHYTAAERARLPTRKLTVRRAHGGHLCGTCCRQRIIRAFLIEEQKIVKHVLKQGKNAATETQEMQVEEKPKKEARKKLGRPEEKKGGKGTKTATSKTAGAKTTPKAATTKTATTTPKAAATTTPKAATTKTTTTASTKKTDKPAKK